MICQCVMELQQADTFVVLKKKKSNAVKSPRRLTHYNHTAISSLHNLHNK